MLFICQDYCILYYFITVHGKLKTQPVQGCIDMKQRAEETDSSVVGLQIALRWILTLKHTVWSSALILVTTISFTSYPSPSLAI